MTKQKLNRYTVRALLMTICFSPYLVLATDDTNDDERHFFDPLISVKVGKATINGKQNENNNAFDIGLGASLSDNIALFVDYADIATVDATHNFQYFDGRVRVSYPLNEKVSADFGGGFGLPLKESDNSYSYDPFPFFDIGFRYEIAENFYLGAGYRNLHQIKRNNDSVNYLFASLDYRFRSSMPQPIEPITITMKPTSVIVEPTPVAIEPTPPAKPAPLIAKKLHSASFALEQWRLESAQEQRLINDLKQIQQQKNIHRVSIVVNNDGSGNYSLNQKLANKRANYAEQLVRDVIDSVDDIHVEQLIHYNSELFKQCSKTPSKQKAFCLQDDRKLQITTYLN